MKLSQFWKKEEKSTPAKTPKASNEGAETLAPDYFERFPFEGLKDSIPAIFPGIEVTEISRLAPSSIQLAFMREGKVHSAVFSVTREEEKPTYHLHGEVKDGKGKKIFEKKTPNLDYISVERAIKLAFHQAFVEE